MDKVTKPQQKQESSVGNKQTPSSTKTSRLKQMKKWIASMPYDEQLAAISPEQSNQDSCTPPPSSCSAKSGVEGISSCGIEERLSASKPMGFYYSPETRMEQQELALEVEKGKVEEEYWEEYTAVLKGGELEGAVKSKLIAALKKNKFHEEGRNVGGYLVEALYDYVLPLVEKSEAEFKTKKETGEKAIRVEIMHEKLKYLANFGLMGYGGNENQLTTTEQQQLLNAVVGIYNFMDDWYNSKSGISMLINQ